MDNPLGSAPAENIPAGEPQTTPPLAQPEEVQSVEPPAPSKPSKFLLFLIIPVVLMLAGASWYLFSNRKVTTTSDESTATVITPTPKEFTVSVSSPTEGDVLTEETVKVMGSTLPSTTILVFTDSDSNSADSDSSGNFEADLVLSEGINTITVTAVSPSGEEMSTAIDVVYEAQVKGISVGGTAPKVLGKATVGNVKDVKSNSITVSDKKTKKETQVGIDSKTQIVGSNNKSVRSNSIKLESTIAIVATDSGTIATGSANKNAAKIYLKQALAGASKRNAVSGVITDISGETLTISHLVQRDRIFTLLTSDTTVIKMKGSKTTALSDLIIGMRIAAVGDRDTDGNLVLVRIHVIPGQATGAFKNPFPTSSTPSATVTVTGNVTPTSSVSTTPSVTVDPSTTLSPTP